VILEAGFAFIPAPDVTYKVRAAYYVGESKWPLNESVLYDAFTIRITNINECDDFAWVDEYGTALYTGTPPPTTVYTVYPVAKASIAADIDIALPTVTND